MRFSHAPRESFEATSRWLGPALLDHVRAGDAVLMIYANDPDLLGGRDPEQIAMVQLATARAFGPFRDLIAKNAANWTIVAAASAAWARKVFPEAAPDVALARLWDAIASLCRLDHPDPTAAWRAHLAALDARKDHLNARRYSALLYTGPGTTLTVGLPDQHVWVTGRRRAATASSLRPTCRPRKSSRCPTKIASTASCRRPSRSAMAAP